MAELALAPSFPTLLQRFFVEHLIQQRAVSPNTVAAYRDTFKLLLAFAKTRTGKSPTDLATADLDAELILAFLAHLERERGNGVRSRNARLVAIRSFLKFASHEDLGALAVIEHSLAIPTKRHDRPMLGFLTRPEMEAVIAAPSQRTWAGRRDHVLFSLLYNTGARVSEVSGLRVSDVMLGAAPVAHLHGKGRKERIVPLWKSTAATVRRWLPHLQDKADADYLFPSQEGGRLSRSSIAQRLALAIKTAAIRLPQLAGRPISPHTIRHTTAMHLLQSGVDITVIALWLGHEDPSTTNIYLEADLAMKEEALSRLQPVDGSLARYRAPDKVMAFLHSL